MLSSTGPGDDVIAWIVLFACRSTDTDTDGGDPVVAPAIVLNEVSTFHGDFVELFNGTDEDADLSTFTITSGGVVVESQQLTGSVPAGGIVVLADADLTLDLDHAGDTVTLVDGNGDVADEVQFAAGEASPSYGRLPDGGPTWVTFATATPGTANHDGLPEANPSPYAIAVNEIVDYGDNEDSVEIYSMEAEDVDLTGFWYIDSSNNAANERFVLTTGTIAPGQFKSLSSHTFGLKREGDRVALFDAENRLVDVLEWDEDYLTESFCRIPDGTGDGRPCSTPTPAAANVE
jgi:hypothetical protein